MKRDHSWLKTGLSRSGKLRAVAMQCRPGEAINHTEEISNGILAGSKFSLWVDLESRKIESPDDWCAEFARNLRASTDVYQSDLSELAHAIGSSLRRYRDDSESDEETKIRTNEELAIDLVSKFETFATKEHYESKTPHVVFSISGLDQYSDDLLSWLSGCLLYTSPSPRDATLSRMPSSA